MLSVYFEVTVNTMGLVTYPSFLIYKMLKYSTTLDLQKSGEHSKLAHSCPATQ